MMKTVQRLAGLALSLLLLGHGRADAATPESPLANDMERRVAACIACHGRVGATSNAGYFPRLAGKPVGYLFNQLRSFRDGRRFNADMRYMVQHLSDAYLMEMATYFANLDLPYPPVPPTSDATPAQLERGRQLALEGDAARRIPACVQCHGAALTGVQPAIPGLLGLPRLYVSSQLGAWLTSDRHALAPDCMAEIGRRMTTADVNAVASWLAVQPMPADPKPAAALPAPLPMACGGAEARHP
jgi:cytochrome c553